MPKYPDTEAILDALNPDEIVQRLQALDRESRALRILLRAARARQRERQPLRRKSSDRGTGST
jgi:hypothetical protein